MYIGAMLKEKINNLKVPSRGCKIESTLTPRDEVVDDSCGTQSQ